MGVATALWKTCQVRKAVRLSAECLRQQLHMNAPVPLMLLLMVPSYFQNLLIIFFHLYYLLADGTTCLSSVLLSGSHIASQSIWWQNVYSSTSTNLLVHHTELSMDQWKETQCATQSSQRPVPALLNSSSDASFPERAGCRSTSLEVIPRCSSQQILKARSVEIIVRTSKFVDWIGSGALVVVPHSHESVVWQVWTVVLSSHTVVNTSFTRCRPTVSWASDMKDGS